MALIPICVGQANESYGKKYQFTLGKKNGDGSGWHHFLAFQAHEASVPNSAPVC